LPRCPLGRGGRHAIPALGLRARLDPCSCKSCRACMHASCTRHCGQRAHPHSKPIPVCVQNWARCIAAGSIAGLSRHGNCAQNLHKLRRQHRIAPDDWAICTGVPPRGAHANSLLGLHKLHGQPGKLHDQGHRTGVPPRGGNTQGNTFKQAVLQKYAGQCLTAIPSKTEARDQSEANCTPKQPTITACWYPSRTSN
jgi:hypothetical protein